MRPGLNGDNLQDWTISRKLQWFWFIMEGLFRALLKFHYMREHLKTIWSIQVLFLLGKIQMVRQSAGNHNIVGSSETTCETLRNNDSNSLKFNSDFKYWFIGFTEGDGSFIVNKTGYLEFKVTQSSIDAQILFYIKKELGFGSVRVQDKNNKTHHFRVRDQKGILKLIHIFNGNLLTERKNNQFKLWLEAFNKVYKTDIKLIQNDNNPTLDNAWLSGLSDSEGCFTVSVIKQSESYNQVQVQYILSQKNELELMTKIAALFDGKVTYLKSYDGYNMTVNLPKLRKVINYFNNYTLKTKKYIDYFNWLKVYKLVINKDHLYKDGLIRVIDLMNKINKKS
uniref:LAGLIDADG/HNH endonuclease n=1 Tax=Parasitella parasitica TaxID=35722 RepID=A0A088SQK0_9FUNG|nr:LAGLIDADG/HNH endonuclease [Parasitella parasitica]AIO05760.1 LAGLIDADG/HNH endonuclease [Parasitella parasitica]